MNILQRKRTKNQILDNVSQAEEVYAEMKECIYPANNIYWCRNMELKPTYDEENHFEKLRATIPYLLSLTKQFKDIYYANEKLCLDYPKLHEFSANYFISQLRALLKAINELIFNIKSLKYYQTDSELKRTVKLLLIASEDIAINLESIIKSQTTEDLL
ncbi:MAG: hypothetical protein IJ415_03215 [Clostridia bacterium]|nr:hypothetical protein [Clostridia bacterium]